MGRPKKRFAGRRNLRVGPGLAVLLSPEDVDLAAEHWYQHSCGYAYQRLYAPGEKVKRPVRWLHHVIAARVLNGKPKPRLVRFKDGARLNCRRDNLVFFY